MPNRTKGLTLAICTHNGKGRLQPTLDHIFAQQVPPIPAGIDWEVLVVDNSSTDGTAEWLEQNCPQGSPRGVRVVREAKLGAIHARQRAIQEARFSYLSYIDDDNWIAPNWVAEIFRIFEAHPSVGIISCPSTAHLAEAPPEYYEGLKGWLAVGDLYPEDGIVSARPAYFWTAGISLRLKAFEDLEGTAYEPCLTGRTGRHTFGGEDHEMCLTLTILGWDVYYTHTTSFTHEIPPSRLTVAYLEKLIGNGTKSGPILDVYKNVYWKKPCFPPAVRMVGAGLQCGVTALKYGSKRMLGRAQGPLHPNRIGYLSALGWVQGYSIHFRRIAQAQRNVSILKSLHKPRGNSPREQQGAV